MLVRHMVKSREPSLLSKEYSGVPSFRAANGLLLVDSVVLTRIAFTPIIPKPATEYDTIFTGLINFQDVLLQKGLPNGPLWSDEGVYRLAKELQLLHPEKFSNIFLGRGGFHLEKVLIACCGKYLEESGISQVLAALEIFGPHVAKSVMEGSHYARGKRGMALIAESIEHIQLTTFLNQADVGKFDDLFRIVSQLQELFSTNESNPGLIRTIWSSLEKELKTFIAEFDVFKRDGCSKSPMFNYWNKFVNDIAPALFDLTRSLREGDWNLHLSAVEKAITLCFTFDRGNYKRWLPLYFNDCLALEDKFPSLHRAFVEGDFVVRHTCRGGSAVPVD